MNRREFLKAAALGSLMFLPGINAWALSGTDPEQNTKKLIVVFLRGGIDGLNVVVPYGDADYYKLRPTIAVGKPGTPNGVIDLNGYFGLHPALSPLMPYWQDKSLAFVHASGSPDPSRSHFDAQDYMEAGVLSGKFVTTGWLNRLVSSIPSQHSPVQAISVGPLLPRIFTGPAPVATVENARGPTNLPIDRPQIAQAFQAMYEGTDDISNAFAEGVAAHKTINSALATPQQKEQIMANRGAPLPTASFGRQLANLFEKDPTVQVAFIDFGGWDTHIGEGNGKGQLANRLTPLAAGLADLIEGLGAKYPDTSIVVMSEFGRTAKENGNGGTDHGHGNVMWVMGGGVSGGDVYGRWAGLANNELHEGRDLPTNTDFRNVIGYVLNEQMKVSRKDLEKIFPDYTSDKNPFTTA
ncbi:MAG TPA: DUF1501 domain-containing protein [Drouetiella sp.]